MDDTLLKLHQVRLSYVDKPYQRELLRTSLLLYQIGDNVFTFHSVLGIYVIYKFLSRDGKRFSKKIVQTDRKGLIPDALPPLRRTG